MRARAHAWRIPQAGQYLSLIPPQCTILHLTYFSRYARGTPPNLFRDDVREYPYYRRAADGYGRNCGGMLYDNFLIDV